MISMTKQEKRTSAAKCYRAWRERTGLVQCEGCEIEMYCPSKLENWDGEKVERETSKEDEAEGKSITVKTLCNLLVFLGEGWVLIPVDHSVKVKSYWRNCGWISIRSELFVRITSGYSKGAIVSKKLLRPPGIW